VAVLVDAGERDGAEGGDAGVVVSGEADVVGHPETSLVNGLKHADGGDRFQLALRPGGGDEQQTVHRGPAGRASCGRCHPPRRLSRPPQRLAAVSAGIVMVLLAAASIWLSVLMLEDAYQVWLEQAFG
jgi:hypothetical protein